MAIKWRLKKNIKLRLSIKNWIMLILYVGKNRLLFRHLRNIIFKQYSL